MEHIAAGAFCIVESEDYLFHSEQLQVRHETSAVKLGLRCAFANSN